MLNDFRKTLTKVIHLRSIIGYNGLVFALKKTPVIGKILPDALYRTTALKVIYWIFHVIKEVFVLFIGKILGLGLIYGASLLLRSAYTEYEMAPGVSGTELFSCFSLFLFLIYALCGMLVNNNYFRCTTEKEYLVFMLRMNAKKLNNTLFIYDLAKLVIGYLIAGIVAIIAGAPFWLWLGIPVLAVCIKLLGAGAQAFIYRVKFKNNKPMKRNTAALLVGLLAGMFAVPAVMVVFINGYYIPVSILLAVSGVLIILGVLGFIELSRFGANLHRKALAANIVRAEVERYKEPDTTKQFKKIKAKGTVKGDKKGFDYLNALFVRRHSRILITKTVVFTVIAVLIIGLVIFSFISSYNKSFGTGNCVHMVFSNLLNFILFGKYQDALQPYVEDSAYSFFRYLATTHLLALMIPVSIYDNSFKSTQAFFINCDNSLMTFSFFKQRDKIIKLFDIRLIQLCKFNIVPAIVCGVAVNLVLFYTGGQDYPFQYLLTFVIVAALSVIESVSSLALYYLFQPFTTTVNVKGGAYMAARIILGVIAVHIFWIPVNSLLLAGVLVVFTAVYVFVLRKLVYKKAPKTWKVKA